MLGEDASVDQLWRTYQVNRDVRLRDRLIELHIPLVEYAARRMIAHMHASVEVQDLVSYGMVGLIDAVEKFDPSAGVKFSTFAPYRIQGAMTDEMRSQAWEPRSVRARFRRVAEAMERLEREQGRPPTEIEVATAVGMTLEELRRTEADMEASRVSSLSALTSDTDDEVQYGEVQRGVPTVDGTEVAPLMDEAAVRLASGLGHLSENERLLLQMIYVNGTPLKQIAVALGVTESWVSHLHTRVLIRLQRTLVGAY